MIHPCISKDLNEHALWLILHGYAPDNICELLDISLSKQWAGQNRSGYFDANILAQFTQ